MKSTLQQLMLDTLNLTRNGQLREAAATVQRFLKGLSAPSGPPPAVVRRSMANEVIDVDAVVIEEERVAPPDTAPLAPASAAAPAPASTPVAAPSAELAADADAPSIAVPPARRARLPPVHGDFIGGRHTEAGLTRDYKLFVPPQSADGQALPLLLMLHGCTQNPDDFAAGTAMNALALEQGFFVLYPVQPADANPQKCWNWFRRSHQQRGRGEPALLAGLTRAVMAEYGIDARRVFVAGLSAGGAMAAITAQAYPEIFAAAGVHSGLAVGAARDVMAALAAMKDGAPALPRVPTAASAITAKTAASATATDSSTSASTGVPTIVFHGDHDSTVNPVNGEQVLAASLAGMRTEAQRDEGVSARGRGYTRTRHRTADGHTVAEHWRIHGAGHAWSGGDAGGSYTDPSGPDASREMLRFFLQHPLRNAAV